MWRSADLALGNSYRESLISPTAAAHGIEVALSHVSGQVFANHAVPDADAPQEKAHDLFQPHACFDCAGEQSGGEQHGVMLGHDPKRVGGIRRTRAQITG